MAQLSEWLRLMLAEIAQRQQQAEAAAADNALRERQSSQGTDPVSETDASALSNASAAAATRSPSAADTSAAVDSSTTRRRRQRASAR